MVLEPAAVRRVPGDAWTMVSSSLLGLGVFGSRRMSAFAGKAVLGALDAATGNSTFGQVTVGWQDGICFFMTSSILSARCMARGRFFERGVGTYLVLGVVGPRHSGPECSVDRIIHSLG